MHIHPYLHQALLSPVELESPHTTISIAHLNPIPHALGR